LLIILRSPKTMVPLAMLLVLLEKPSMRKVHSSSWFHNVFTYNGKVIEYWTNFSLKISFNSKQKIVVQFDVLLVFWKTLNEYVLMKVIWKNLDSTFHYYSRGYSYEKHPSCFIFGLKDATFVLFFTTVIVRFSYLLGLLLWRPVQPVSMLLASTRVLDKLRSTWR
jgi:hypothetical protein